MKTRPTRASLRNVAVAGIVLVVAAGALTAPAAASESTPVTDLDGSCMLLRVIADGTTAGQNNYIEKASVGYGTRADAASAEPIAFDATGLGTYQLTDSGGSDLYESVLGYVWAGDGYGPEADWTITGTEGAYRITATTSGTGIGSRSGKLTVAAGSFTFEPATGCSFPPAATTGLITPATEPAVNADGTLNGYIDAHAHPAGSAAFGGEFVCGSPFAPGGIEVALGGCTSHTIGAGALFEAVIGGSDPFAGDEGWPGFSDWPSSEAMLHEQAYYKGVERAWQGGMRVLNALLVGNRVICELYPERVTSCDEGEQILAQAQLLNDMQDYIDAQSGGPGEGWFQIATTPVEVREIADEGKLAVVLGAETSELFGCRVIDGVAQCDEEDIDTGLDEMSALGVSGLYPIHKFDNAFGGTRFDAGVTGAAINVGNLISTGSWWQAESCAGPSDNEQPISNDAIADLLSAGVNVPAGTTLPVYPEGPICNVQELTALGEYLVEGMMDRGMIIHIDHMGVRTAQAVLDITEDADYSGVASVHSWSDPTITGRIAQSGGFVAGYAYSAADAGNGEPDFLTQWRENSAAAAGTMNAYGVGSDVNGLAVQPGARLDADTVPLQYPFTTPNGAVFERQVFGDRTWDLNTDGVSQYGMYADWFADVIAYAGSDSALLEQQMMGGAESYVQMWEEALSWTE
ncbi:microsomal dipeptidase-like Zn-dependent dipeptidase [Microbacterium halimionae]|uniref:Microsomal dipeptidase-like Zn-dependent dipeptidase n=1 Tax=Microbacterium halimionae TaxID=1526413 RepID=A0A7W3PLS3_9MICO|nr:hypothetical protein [Microbacterium halimionae]MBA8816296.1 microsomal dipeptidase-like Zn-dependent dipeptidase [Microbacterium halimionae]NII96499.1 microsomal dipeptidase-like Zn-dependent dipeptidase [Microbacterium halimionae]